MRFDIITIFPQIFDSFLQTSLIARGINKRIIEVNIFDLRNAALDKHKSVDDRPYGGGAGMVLRVDVIDRMINEVLKKFKTSRKKTKIILLTPQGKTFNQLVSRELSTVNRLILICGHYEGFDERIRDLVDEEISIGDYILTGGELPAIVLVDSISRHLPGFLGKESSLLEESFSMMTLDQKVIENCLEYPQYTRPEVYKGSKVPEVLLGGNHHKIAKWRTDQAVKKTLARRPDLLTIEKV